MLSCRKPLIFVSVVVYSVGIGGYAEAIDLPGTVRTTYPYTTVPSFDCTKAVAPDEVAICGFGPVANLEHIASVAFVEARKISGRSKALPVARKAMKDRRACGSNIMCLDGVFRTEIAEFEKLGATIATVTPPPTNKATKTDDGNTATGESPSPAAQNNSQQSNPAPSDGDASATSSATSPTLVQEGNFIGEPINGPPPIIPGQPGYGYQQWVMSNHLTLLEDSSDWSPWKEVNGAKWPGLKYRYWADEDGDGKLYCIDIKNDSDTIGYNVYMTGIRMDNNAPLGYNVLQRYLKASIAGGSLVSGNPLDDSETDSPRLKRPLLFSPGGRYQAETRQPLTGPVGLTVTRAK